MECSSHRSSRSLSLLSVDDTGELFFGSPLDSGSVCSAHLIIPSSGLDSSSCCSSHSVSPISVEDMGELFADSPLDSGSVCFGCKSCGTKDLASISSSHFSMRSIHCCHSFCWTLACSRWSLMNFHCFLDSLTFSSSLALYFANFFCHLFG